MTHDPDLAIANPASAVSGPPGAREVAERVAAALAAGDLRTANELMDPRALADITRFAAEEIPPFFGDLEAVSVEDGPWYSSTSPTYDLIFTGTTPPMTMRVACQRGAALWRVRRVLGVWRGSSRKQEGSMAAVPDGAQRATDDSERSEPHGGERDEPGGG